MRGEKSFEAKCLVRLDGQHLSVISPCDSPDVPTLTESRESPWIPPPIPLACSKVAADVEPHSGLVSFSVLYKLCWLNSSDSITVVCKGLKGMFQETPQIHQQ